MLKTLKSNYKNGAIDIYKMLIAITIAYGHAHIAGMGTPCHHLTNLVEGFLLITGYFTNEHFNKTNVGKIDDIFLYTYRKFKRFFVYIIISVFIAYLLITVGQLHYGASVRNLISKLLDFPFDAFLLNSVSMEIGYVLPQLWTISNMFIVFPAVCMFCCINNKNIKVLVSLYFPLMFYARLDPAFGTVEFPTYILRATAGMFIGVFVSEIQPILKNVFKNGGGNNTEKENFYVRYCKSICNSSLGVDLSWFRTYEAYYMA